MMGPGHKHIHKRTTNVQDRVQDKLNLKKLATGLSLTKLGLSAGRPFRSSRAGTRMVTFIFLYFYFYIF